VLVARELAVRPDPLGIARTLAASGRPGTALLHAAETGDLAWARWSWIGACPDRRSHALDPLADDPDARAASAPRGSALAAAPRWIGVLPYEHRRDLERPAWRPVERRPAPRLDRPIWLRYPAVVGVDHLTGRVMVTGTSRRAVDALAAAVEGPAPAAPPALRIEVTDEEPAALHADRIRAAKELILAGDLYQVNLARRLLIRVVRGDALTLYASLVRAAPTPLGAFVDLGEGLRVVSTSPELFLRAEPDLESPEESRRWGALLTAPIKGTRPRGKDAKEDRALAEELDRDPKERAELTMIVDVERNDLGRVAVPGSVRVTSPPRVHTHRTLHHRVACVAARARPECSREDVLRALLPSGSVTGAPKVRAMEVIAALEPRRRGLYTGAIGYVAHDGGLTMAMAIRTAVLEDGEGEYWTGGGIVADSDPEREVEETRWKALQLQRAAQG
jgi:anthranilate/para-aminobenzoate synthase component I